MELKRTNGRSLFAFCKATSPKCRDKTTKKDFSLRLVWKLSRSTLVRSGKSSFPLGIKAVETLHGSERTDRSHKTRGTHKKTHAMKCRRWFSVQLDRDGEVRKLPIDTVSIEQKFDLMHGAIAPETSL